MNHHTFRFDRCFDEKCTSEQVYDETAEGPLRAACAGGQGTIMMFGQTGSGKTYTMSTMYERVAKEIFSTPARIVHVSFIELAGSKKCADILNRGRRVDLKECGTGGVVEAFPAVEIPITQASDLVSIIQFALSRRATAATGVHDRSSRTHACCRVRITEAGSSGILNLVDLAGSEHRIDSSEHDANRRKECAQINSSLMALKECVRAQMNGASYIPYRQSNLTLLLKACFASDDANTSIIVTVSPSSKDTEHSLNTLRHACVMKGELAEETRWLAGGDVQKRSCWAKSMYAPSRKRERA